MEEGKPSATAMLTAMVRAAHLLWDEPPKIFEDTLALRLSRCDSEAALKAQLDKLDAEVARGTNPDFALISRRSLTAMVIMRSRYVEDEVEEAVAKGVSQYVILGAGLDSFAYRRLDLAKVLHVFEVDHPATQAWKRTRLHAAGVKLPPNLSVVPVDFEKESLIDNLQRDGYRKDAPGFFSWLGVTMYLTVEAIFGTLRTIAALPSGTEILFEYNASKEFPDEETQKILAAVMAVAAARGEPMRSLFEPARLVERVRKLGFAAVSDFGPDQAVARYFAGHADHLRPSVFNHCMRAQVGRRPD
ncbi:MAG: class I SAM-dependent methyltransferase [Deltaproteobacteria bacterium]|nr:class I SAM-dependent methyltransferase [Deltaproteobacteria bacterium]